MLGPIVGAGIAAGASLIGGRMNSKATQANNAQTLALAREQMALQKEFAKNGLTWKIDDALRNADKVHPIYSLGSSGASYTPVTAAFSADHSVGNSIAAAGQDIGRAVNATATQGQRATAFTQAAQSLALEKGALENELLKQQLASQNGRLRQVAQPPFPGAAPYDIPGQTSSGPAALIKSTPLEVAPGHSDQPQSEGGAITDVGYSRTATGWVPVPSKDVKERIEDDFIQQTLHTMRNNVLPTFGFNMSPPPFKPPEGKEWHFHVPTQEYRLLDTHVGRNPVTRGFTTRYRGKNETSSGW